MPPCRHCSTLFEISQADLAFLDKLSPIINNKKYPLPPPALCPDCRQQRRLSWRNERVLYKRMCDFSKKNIISMYSPDKKYKVYNQDIWWSDKWEPLAYGQPFDFSRPFFDQFQELQSKVPRLSLFHLKSTNSEYTNHSFGNKNCYMGVAFGNSEDCMYGHWILQCQDVLDSLYCDKCELCYECIYCLNCYETCYSEYCENLINCLLCFECKGCENCLACTQQNHVKFHILNQPVSAEVFHKTKLEILMNPQKFQELFHKYQALKNTDMIHRASRQINCENCLGNDLINCKNTKYSYNCKNLEDCRYVYDGADIKDSMDSYEHGWFDPGELIYECHAGKAGHNLKFCHICSDSHNLMYCDCCSNNCADCFGCSGLKHQRYCILNKQYTKKEYETLVPKIIEHMMKSSVETLQCNVSTAKEWGEFFPSSLSPFGYNETPAQEYYPLTKEEALAKGFKWKEEQTHMRTNAHANDYKIPDNIHQVPDTVINQILTCPCGKNYRIIAQELKFYRQTNLPIPKNCPDCRHKNRMILRGPRKLWPRTCDRCHSEIFAIYPPENPKKIYCEKCFLEKTQ